MVKTYVLFLSLVFNWLEISIVLQIDFSFYLVTSIFFATSNNRAITDPTTQYVLFFFSSFFDLSDIEYIDTMYIILYYNFDYYTIDFNAINTNETKVYMHYTNCKRWCVDDP